MCMVVLKDADPTYTTEMVSSRAWCRHERGVKGLPVKG